MSISRAASLRATLLDQGMPDQGLEDEFDDEISLGADIRPVLALSVLRSVLSRRLLRRLKSAGRFIMIVRVPSPQWVVPIAEAIKRRFSRADVQSYAELRKDYSPKHTSAIYRGASLIAVSHDPDRLVPLELRLAADHQLAIKGMTISPLVAAMKHVQFGSVPRSVKCLAIETLDFDEICACLIPGNKPAASVAKLQVAIERKRSPRKRAGIVLPNLKDAIEYGEAQVWALQLARDLEDLRAGRIEAHDTDRGALIFGPPGNGKSLLAEMLGEACNVPVILSSMGDLFSKGGGHLGDVIKAQREVFNRAASQAPAILYIDEIDALPSAESLDSRNRDFWMPLILDFFIMLDSSVSSRDGLVVIGATNRPENVSAALMRPGRLERKIFLGPPGPAGLENIFRHHLGSDLERQDLAHVVSAGLGASGATVMDWVRSARRNARYAGRALELEDLLRVVRPGDRRSHGERWRVAVHEAGHALAGLVLDDDLLNVSLAHTVTSGGTTSFTPDPSLTVTSKRMERRLVALLAGHAAEVEIFGCPSTGAGGSETSDLALATEAVAKMLASFGMGGNLLWLGPPDEAMSLVRTSTGFAKQVHEELRRLHSEAASIIARHRVGLIALAGALLKHERLTAAEARNAAGLLATERSE